MKTQKVLDLVTDLYHIECVKHTEDKVNPYRLYTIYWSYDPDRGYHKQHRKQIAKYADLRSVLALLETVC